MLMTDDMLQSIIQIKKNNMTNLLCSLKDPLDPEKTNKNIENFLFGYSQASDEMLEDPTLIYLNHNPRCVGDSVEDTARMTAYKTILGVLAWDHARENENNEKE